MLLDKITFGTISNDCLEFEFSNPKQDFYIESKDSRASLENFKSALFQANKLLMNIIILYQHQLIEKNNLR